MIGTQPYILMPAFFMVLYLARDIHYTLRLLVLCIVLIGAFRFSRGEIIYAVILMLMYVIMVFSTNKSIIKGLKTSLKLIFFLTCISLAVPLILPLVNERLWAFLLFKLSFFMADGVQSGNFGASAGGRVFQLYNIIGAEAQYLLFGKGLGSYFTFNNVPLPYALTLSDFSQDQINTGYFYKPHTFINMILLKYGFFVLGIYVWVAIHLFLKSIKQISISRCYSTQSICIFTGCISLYMLNMYWQPNLIFIVVLCVYLVYTIEQQNKPGKL